MNRLDPLRQPGFGTLSALMLAVLYLPVLLLVVLSFNQGVLFHRWDGFSVQWYAAALADEGFRRAAINSITVAIAATAIATVAALFAAFALDEQQAKGNALAAATIDLPLVIPEIVMAIGMLAVFSTLRGVAGFDLGLFDLILAHAMFCIPFALGPIRAQLRRIDRSLALAAADLYASPAKVFSRVTMPLLAPGIASGASLSFIVSFDDFAISQMVAGPGETTLPAYIWAQMRRPLTPEVNAMCAIVLTVSIILVCLSAVLVRPRNASKSDQ